MHFCPYPLPRFPVPLEPWGKPCFCSNSLGSVVDLSVELVFLEKVSLGRIIWELFSSIFFAAIVQIWAWLWPYPHGRRGYSWFYEKGIYHRVFNSYAANTMWFAHRNSLGMALPLAIAQSPWWNFRQKWAAMTSLNDFISLILAHLKRPIGS